MLKVPKEKPKPKLQHGGAPAVERRIGSSGGQADLGPVDEVLYEKLRSLRFEIATEEGVPAYIVFSNATLSDMSARKPRTEEEFLHVSGVGATKAARYGERFLAAINEYLVEGREA